MESHTHVDHKDARETGIGVIIARAVFERIVQEPPVAHGGLVKSVPMVVVTFPDGIRSPEAFARGIEG
jgi:hypothetical protein